MPMPLHCLLTKIALVRERKIQIEVVKGRKTSRIASQRIKVSGCKFIFLVLYIDDTLIDANDLAILCKIEVLLSKNFEMKDMGNISYLIGIKIF